MNHFYAKYEPKVARSSRKTEHNLIMSPNHALADAYGSFSPLGVDFHFRRVTGQNVDITSPLRLRRECVLVLCPQPELHRHGTSTSTSTAPCLSNRAQPRFSVRSTGIAQLTDQVSHRITDWSFESRLLRNQHLLQGWLSSFESGRWLRDRPRQ